MISHKIVFASLLTMGVVNVSCLRKSDDAQSATSYHMVLRGTYDLVSYSNREGTKFDLCKDGKKVSCVESGSVYFREDQMAQKLGTVYDGEGKAVPTSHVSKSKFHQIGGNEQDKANTLEFLGEDGNFQLRLRAEVKDIGEGKQQFTWTQDGNVYAVSVYKRGNNDNSRSVDDFLSGNSGFDQKITGAKSHAGFYKSASGKIYFFTSNNGLYLLTKEDDASKNYTASYLGDADEGKNLSVTGDELVLALTGGNVSVKKMSDAEFTALGSEQLSTLREVNSESLQLREKALGLGVRFQLAIRKYSNDKLTIAFGKSQIQWMKYLSANLPRVLKQLKQEFSVDRIDMLEVNDYVNTQLYLKGEKNAAWIYLPAGIATQTSEFEAALNAGRTNQLISDFR